MRIVFVADESLAYTTFERDRVLAEWKTERSETRIITKLDEAGVASLFGDAPVSVLTFDTKEEIKEAAERLKAADKGELTRYSTPGLIMLTNVSRVSTKTIEKLVDSLGGEVILSKASGSKESPARKLVDELMLSREAKEFLKDYAGDDYGSILGLVKTLGALSAKQQQSVSIDDLLVRMPSPPGAIPPWEIEPAVLSGNVTKAITLYRRVSQTSHLLVVLAILKNKFKLVFKVASLLANKPSTQLAEIATSLSAPNNYPLRLSYDTAKRLGLPRATRILELMVETERRVKGGSSGNPHIHMESMLVQVAAIAKS